jgi:hypothetical protein
MRANIRREEGADEVIFRTVAPQENVVASAGAPSRWISWMPLVAGETIDSNQ